jgi:hypothetical protein
MAPGDRGFESHPRHMNTDRDTQTPSTVKRSDAPYLVPQPLHDDDVLKHLTGPGHHFDEHGRCGKPGRVRSCEACLNEGWEIE